MRCRRVAVNAAPAPGRLHQPALLDRRLDERGEQRVRRERPGFQLGMVLHADEPRMVGALAELRQHAVRRQAGEMQAGALDPCYNLLGASAMASLNFLK